MGRNDRYEVEMTGSRRRARKLIAAGWELVGQNGGFFMSGHTFTLRRPNPDYRPRLDR